MSSLGLPKLPPAFVRTMLAGHSALGLTFAALIYLVCFSGTLAVFTNQFYRWENPRAPTVTQATPQAMQHLVEAALKRDGKIDEVYLALPFDALPRLSIHTDGPSGDRQWSADAQGNITGSGETPWAEFVENLHINLLLPGPWGDYVVGFTGVALFSLMLSGILAHPRIFRDAFHLRRGGSVRVQEADLHNRLGVWALPFHLLISLTGALLGMTTIILSVLALVLFKGDMDAAYKVFVPPEPKADIRPAPLPDLRPMFATLSRIAPDAVANYVSIDDLGHRSQHVLIIAGRNAELSRGDNYGFSGDGKLIDSPPPNGNTLGTQVLGAISILHFGWFGGWPLLVAYGLLGLALTLLTATGVTIWIARRRDQGRAVPGWERLWTAFIWSQPVAVAGTALVGLLAPKSALVLVWSILSLLCCASAGLWQPLRISAILRFASAGLLCAVAAAHSVAYIGGRVDPVAWIVDGAIVVAAAVLAAGPRPARRT